MLEEECWMSFHFTFLLSHTYLFQPISYSLAAGGSICWQGLFKHQQNACSYCSGWNWLLEPTQTALVWEPALGVWVRLFLVVCSYCSKNVSSFFSHSVHLCSCCLVFVQSLCLWTVQINSLNKFCGFLHFQLLFSLGFGVFPLYGFIFLSSFQLSKGMWHFVFGVGFLLFFFFFPRGKTWLWGQLFRTNKLQGQAECLQNALGAGVQGASGWAVLSLVTQRRCCTQLVTPLNDIRHHWSTWCCAL